MKTSGELVREAIDFMNSGLSQYAFAPTASAIDETAKNSGGFENFLKENWELIEFMGLPNGSSLPLNISFGAKRIVPQLGINASAREITIFAVGETLKNGKLPNAFSFTPGGEFDIKSDKLLLPASLIFGLLGSVIVHPENKGQQIGDQYWMNISDFKMFISELWGRRDLAERIRKFYLE